MDDKPPAEFVVIMLSEFEGRPVRERLGGYYKLEDAKARIKLELNPDPANKHLSRLLGIEMHKNVRCQIWQSKGWDLIEQ